jgi:anaerobic magnesium-protoporphyrin IX monomethyl ester cyclase
MIVLYFPVVSYMTGLDKGYHRFPYAVWSLVPELRKAGFDVKIIDGRVDSKEELWNVLKEKPLFVGISSLTGAQLLDAMKTSKKIKELSPETPIVWGGWHVTLDPNSAADESFIDHIIVGRGEKAIVDVAKALERHEKVEHVVRAPLEEHFNPIPFWETDINKYGPMFGYLTSTGCAWGCTFCAIQQVYHHKMFFKPMDQVIFELKYIVDTHKNIKQINIDDDLFFIKKDRVIEFCKKWNNYNGIPMSVLAHVNVLNKYDHEMWSMIAETGFRHILIGAESGNQSILDRLCKHQTPKQMLKFVEKTAELGLVPELSTMTGFWDSDTVGDFQDTIMFLQEAGKINPMLAYKIFWARPFPGTPLFQEYTRRGYWMPSTMKEWANYTLRYAPYWVDRELEDMVNFFVYAFQPQVGWNFTWPQFEASFEHARSYNQIPRPGGM